MRYMSERKYNRYLIIGIALYILLVWQVVPFIHEIGHVIALKSLKCNYWVGWDKGYFKELYGTIYNKCDINKNQQILVYLAGIIMTSTIGLLFLILEILANLRHKIEYALLFLFISYAFLMDALTYLFFPKGDIENILKIMGKENMIIYVPIIGIMLLITMLTYLYLNIHDELEVIIVKEEGLIRKWIKRLKRYWKKQQPH